MTDTLEVDGVTFRFGQTIGKTRNTRDFHLGKPVELTQAYLELVGTMADQNVVELGILQGGSAALATLAGRPRRMVVVDLGDPVPALLELVEERGLGDRLIPHFGVDQADKAAIARIADEAFGEEPLDLVIDDASHLLDATRSTFEVLFPRLRPGGRYLIEDWHWELQYVAMFERLVDDEPDVARSYGQAIDPTHSLRALKDTVNELTDDPRIRDALGPTDTPLRPYRPLALLALELAAAVAVAPGLVQRIDIDRWWITVERGPEPWPSPMDLQAITGLAGDLAYGPAGSWR